jgi:hypothetical protein
MLIHGDGSQDGNNSVYVDVSNNATSISANGEVAIGTFTPFGHGSFCSSTFEGTASYYTVAATSTLNVYAGNTTIECWVNFKSVALTPHIFQLGTGSTVRSALYVKNSALVWNVSGTDRITSSTTLITNRWYHVAITRSSVDNTQTLYLDGVSQGSTTATLFTGSPALHIGFQAFGTSANDYLNGSISNFRITSSVLYTSDFTPPTEPLTAISGTVILTCQSPIIADNSSNNLLVTRNSNPGTTNFNPFRPSSVYSSSENGGSVYFDGTGDHIDATITAPGTGDFTYECWVYPTMGTNRNVFHTRSDNNNTGFTIMMDAGSTSLRFYNQTATIINSSTFARPRPHTWHHIAVTRSGSTLRLFSDGSLVGNATFTTNLTSTFLRLGGNVPNVGNSPLLGYLAGFRAVVGTCLYTASFTPSYSPPAVVANTACLFNFTTGSVIDSAGLNNIQTAGNSRLSSTQAKFGGTSMYFDGSSDFITIPHLTGQVVQLFRGADFTVECWARPTGGTGTLRGLISKGTSTTGWSLVATANNVWGFQHSATTVSGSSAVELDTWTHLAMVRNNGVINLYVNGTSVANAAVTTDFNQTDSVYIGRRKDNTEPSYEGFIDEVRITTGIARYTSSFTPSPAPFQNL